MSRAASRLNANDLLGIQTGRRFLLSRLDKGDEVEQTTVTINNTIYHGVKFYCKGKSSCVVDETKSKVWSSKPERSLLWTGASDAERVARAFRHLLKLSSEENQGPFGADTTVRGKGRLGVIIQPVTDELAQGLNLDKARGVLVADIADNGPAQEAKVKIGDVILEYDGKQIAEQSELVSMISNTPVGKKVTLVVWRKSKKLRLGVVIGESK